MKETIKETATIIKDRLRNPFVFSFIISYMIYNWKAFMIFIFSNLSIVEKIKLSSSYSNWCKMLWFPLGTALIYVLVIPYITVGIEFLLMKQKNWLFSVSSKDDENKHGREIGELTHKVNLEIKEIELRSKSNEKDTIDNYIEEIESRDKRIEQLNKLVNDIQSKNRELESELENNSTRMFNGTLHENTNHILDEQVYRVLMFENGKEVIQKYDDRRKVFYYVNAHTGKELSEEEKNVFLY